MYIPNGFLSTLFSAWLANRSLSLQITESGFNFLRHAEVMMNIPPLIIIKITTDPQLHSSGAANKVDRIVPMDV